MAVFIWQKESPHENAGIVKPKNCKNSKLTYFSTQTKVSINLSLNDSSDDKEVYVHNPSLLLRVINLYQTSDLFESLNFCPSFNFLIVVDFIYFVFSDLTLLP